MFLYEHVDPQPDWQAHVLVQRYSCFQHLGIHVLRRIVGIQFLASHFIGDTGDNAGKTLATIGIGGDVGGLAYLDAGDVGLLDLGDNAQALDVP